MLYDNLSVNEKGHLVFAGADVTVLAKKYGTPLYLLDEDRVRAKCREYSESIKKHFGEQSMPIYAGKALSFKKLYSIVSEEGLGVDAVSVGEIFSALKAGVDPGRIFFHGNNKTDYDINYAVSSRVGYFVVDNRDELDAIGEICVKNCVNQKILLRINPDIDAHTHRAISTGMLDSKFGSPIKTGQADELAECALSMEGVTLCGYHCHIGSQIFDSAPYILAARTMVEFAVHIREKFGFTPRILNFGGGFGVRYVESQPQMDIDKAISEISVELKTLCKQSNIDCPSVILEPGRSIVADCGITLYSVGSVKTIPRVKNYVSIDGGMTDNPRYALYQSEYTVINASRAAEECNFKCTLAGRCCESGDIIQENILLPHTQKGDCIAVLTTGAYNYSMASNYNKIPKPPIVLLSGGRDTVGVSRETLDDLIKNEI